MKKKILISVFLGLFLLSSSVYAAGEDDATVLYNKGIDLYEQNKVEQSIATFKKAISINPDFYEAYYNLARIQEAAGHTQDAMTSYEKLLTIAPDDYESVYQFGELLYKRGYLSRSLSYLSKIPSGSEYKSKADTLSEKIKKRQLELQEESKIKAEQQLKTSTVGNIPAPSGLVIDSNSNMYVASFTENKIIKISKNANEKIVFADKTKMLDGPIGLAIDSYDNIYVANYNKGSVVLFDPNANVKVLMYVKKPYCISLDEQKKKIYVTEQQNNSVVSYDISDILKASMEKKKMEVKQNSAISPVGVGSDEIKSAPEKKVIEAPETKPILVTPSIQEAPFTKSSPASSITAPIMVPSGSLFD